jgi:protocatechuate 3,4-dioxygenase beta subunit
MSHHDHEHDRGLEYDLATLRSRRGFLGLLAGASAVALTACAAEVSGGTQPSSGITAAITDDGSGCDVIPQETAGPYPGDGSNGPNVLTQSGIVRSDITTSFGNATGVADGVPVTITLELQDAENGCTPLVGAAVYLWHADALGNYSLYSAATSHENYLRGVQESDSEGRVSFTSIFPGCYPGRWPHAHFEVYRSLSEATAAGQIRGVSQLAFPQDACTQVYSTSKYPGSASHLGSLSLAADNVFGEDSGVRQLATMSGSIGSRLTATLVVPI